MRIGRWASPRQRLTAAESHLEFNGKNFRTRQLQPHPPLTFRKALTLLAHAAFG